MSGINQIMNIAQWALFAQQQGIAVTSHNVANVNTPGFSRQRLSLESSIPQDSSPGQMGAGVQATAVGRVYDQLLVNQARAELARQGMLNTQQSGYNQLEAIFSSTADTDLSVDIASFWGAWTDLSTHPEGDTERAAVLNTGNQLATRFRNYSEKLENLQAEMDRTAALNVEQINEITKQIAELNKQITRAEYVDQNANDLRDNRDQLVNELTSLMEVQSWEGDDLMVSVMGPGGKPLVVGADSWELEMRPSSDARQADIVWKDDDGNESIITSQIKSGSLGGILNIRDTVIPQNMEDLNNIAQSVIWAVNEIHSESWGSAPVTEMTSGTRVPDADAALTGFTNDELPFASKIQAGEDIHIWLYDDSDPPVAQRQISVTVTGTMTLRELADAIDSGNTDPDIQADVTSDGRLTIQSTGTSRFAISKDDSDVFAAIGMNTFFSGSDASDIGLSSNIKGKPELVAASRVDDDGSLTGAAGTLASGDNRGALDIASLQEAALVGNDTAEWAYSTMIGNLGVEASTVYDNAEYQDLVLEELNSQIQSVSGVNLDEEVIKLMEYQWAYQAAASLISATEEMFQNVFQLVR